MTDYIVFKFEKNGDWQIQVNIQARSAQSAIRKFLDSLADPGTEGKFAAVPARSFQPVTVKVETKTALKFS